MKYNGDTIFGKYNTGKGLCIAIINPSASANPVVHKRCYDIESSISPVNRVIADLDNFAVDQVEHVGKCKFAKKTNPFNSNHFTQ